MLDAASGVGLERCLECHFGGTDCEAAMTPWASGSVTFGTHTRSIGAVACLMFEMWADRDHGVAVVKSGGERSKSCVAVRRSRMTIGPPQ